MLWPQRGFVCVLRSPGACLGERLVGLQTMPSPGSVPPVRGKRLQQRPPVTAQRDLHPPEGTALIWQPAHASGMQSTLPYAWPVPLLGRLYLVPVK